MNLSELQAGFEQQGVPKDIVSKLLAEYAETKKRFHLNDHQPTAVDAGRFAEAALRLVEWALFNGTYTAFSKNLAKLTTARLAQFEGQPSLHESLRIHIPRALYSVYAVRNKRDAAHLNDGIDANLQDSTYVVSVLDWVLAEFVRLYHQVSPAAAQAIIRDLVTREVPVIEEINGQPVCSKTMPVGDLALVFLYRAGQDEGVSLPELQRQMRHKDRSNLTKAIRTLDNKGLALLHPDTHRAHITTPGMKSVETRRLLHPPA